MPVQTLQDLGWSHDFQSQLDLESLESQQPFRVVSVARNGVSCLGLDPDNVVLAVDFPAHHWRDHAAESRPTVGDWIMVDAAGRPVRLLARRSLLKRRGSGPESAIQLLAANIDTLFIVTSCNEDFNINRIERYLAIAAETRIHCVLVLTKADLCADPAPYLNALSQSHSQLPVEQVNATDGATLDGLRKWITRGQTVALLGSSGVGKSTLTNQLQGRDDQATAGIREADGKGRHTTTARSLHALPGGGLLLDTPGMRELQLVDSDEGIRATFPDIEALARGCRFHDCRHHAEPGCAVTQAVEEGELEARQLDNYRKLLSEQARNDASLAERRQSDKARGRFYKSAQKSARKFKSRE